MGIQHGIKITDNLTGSRSIKDASTSVIGLVATAYDADATYFPANTPVLVDTMSTALAKAGTGGTLVKSLSAIADVTTPNIVVVRVPDTQAAKAAVADIVGTIDANGNATGIQALKMAEIKTGVRTKILGAPGWIDPLIANALSSVGDKLRAFSYFKPKGANSSAVITDMANYGGKNMMAIWPDTNAWEGDAVARALGLRAKLDNDYGFVHKSISNVVVDGVSSIVNPPTWDISGISSGAQVLNDANITTLIRKSGFRFWGNRTCSSDTRFAFEVATRTDYAIKDMIEEAEFSNVDAPLSVNLIRSILSELNAKARTWVKLGYVMGLEFWWDGDINPATSLSGGAAKIRYKFTPIAPLESQEYLAEITSEYYLNFGSSL